jgi:hypothetical protein
VASQRRGAGPPLARPSARRSWRSKKALRRPLAAFPSLSASARARTRARRASSATAGTYTGGRSPDRSSRASCTASQRSVLTRSPAFWGIWEGATPQPVRVFLVSSRYNPSPHGPAAYPKGNFLPLACSVRLSVSLSPGRVPSVPKHTTSASRASDPEAPAMLSLWTSNPITSVLPSALADLLLYVNAALFILRLWSRTG